jgi:hypothetical protein
MSSILPAMRQLLIDRGFNQSSTPIVLARYPAAPDNVLVLREIVDAPGKYYDGNNLPAVGGYVLHVTTRAGKDAGANVALNTAWDALRRLSGRHVSVTVGTGLSAVSYRFDWIRSLGSPQLAGYDDNDRPEVVTRFVLQRVESLEVPYAP